MRRIPALVAALGVGVLCVSPACATGDIQDVTNQAWRGVAIVPSDTAQLAAPTDALYTEGTSGNAACTMVVRFTGAPTTSVTLSFLTPGFPYPFSVIQVMNTGTTCTGIVGLYRSPH